MTTNMSILDFKKRPFRKGLALLTLIAYLSHSSVWASPGIDAAAFRKTDEIAAASFPSLIPSELGRVTEQNSGNPKIYLIQDAHGQYHAQKSAEAILDFLAASGKISSVLVEGGAGEQRPERLAFFRDRNLNLKIADSLMRISQIGGAEKFLLKNSGKVSAYGVEDLPLYLKNFRLYQKTSEYKKDADVWVSQNFTSLFARASRSFNKPLFDFFKEYAAFEEERSELPAYLKQLEKRAGENLKLDFKNHRLQLEWPMLVRFTELKRREPLLKLKEAEKQRAALIKWADSNNLPQNLQEGLLVQLHTPDFDRRFFWETFFQTAQGFKFEDYPEFFALEGYSILENEIDFNALQDEIKKLREELFLVLLKTSEERAIYQSYRDTVMLKKAFSLSLIREEYLDFASGKAAQLLPAELKPAAEAVTDFYKIALERDAAMFENISAALERADGNTALVAGGFHTRGLCEYFVQKNIPYAVISPHVSKIESDSGYSAAMTGEKTQIDFGASSVRVPSWMQVWKGRDSLPAAIERQRLEIEKQIYQFGAKQSARPVERENFQSSAAARSELRSRDSGEAYLRKEFILDGINYRIRSFIGGGQYASVYEAVRLDGSGKSVAVKIFEMDASEQVVLDEVNAMRKFQAGGGPYAPAVYGMARIKRGLQYHPAIVMDLVQGESLEGWKTAKGKDFNPAQIAKLVFPILRAVAALHASKVVHMDLNPNNLMGAWDEADTGAKVIDLGLAKYEGDEYYGTAISIRYWTTPLYAAPEIWAGRAQFVPQADVYSLGVLLYWLATGTYPFSESDPVLLKAQKIKSELSLEEIENGLRRNGAESWVPFAPVIFTALRTPINKRYKDAGDMLKAFERIWNSTPEVGLLKADDSIGKRSELRVLTDTRGARSESRIMSNAERDNLYREAVRNLKPGSARVRIFEGQEELVISLNSGLARPGFPLANSGVVEQSGNFAFGGGLKLRKVEIYARSMNQEERDVIETQGIKLDPDAEVQPFLLEIEYEAKDPDRRGGSKGTGVVVWTGQKYAQLMQSKDLEYLAAIRKLRPNEPRVRVFENDEMRVIQLNNGVSKFGFPRADKGIVGSEGVFSFGGTMRKKAEIYIRAMNEDERKVAEAQGIKFSKDPKVGPFVLEFEHEGKGSRKRGSDKGTGAVLWTGEKYVQVGPIRDFTYRAAVRKLKLGEKRVRVFKGDEARLILFSNSEINGSFPLAHKGTLGHSERFSFGGGEDLKTVEIYARAMSDEEKEVLGIQGIEFVKDAEVAPFLIEIDYEAKNPSRQGGSKGTLLVVWTGSKYAPAGPVKDLEYRVAVKNLKPDALRVRVFEADEKRVLQFKMGGTQHSFPLADTGFTGKDGRFAFGGGDDLQKIEVYARAISEEETAAFEGQGTVFSKAPKVKPFILEFESTKASGEIRPGRVLWTGSRYLQVIETPQLEALGMMGAVGRGDWDAARHYFLKYLWQLPVFFRDGVIHSEIFSQYVRHPGIEYQNDEAPLVEMSEADALALLGKGPMGESLALLFGKQKRPLHVALDVNERIHRDSRRAEEGRGLNLEQVIRILGNMFALPWAREGDELKISGENFYPVREGEQKIGAFKLVHLTSRPHLVMGTEGRMRKFNGADMKRAVEEAKRSMAKGGLLVIPADGQRFTEEYVRSMEALGFEATTTAENAPEVRLNEVSREAINRAIPGLGSAIAQKLNSINSRYLIFRLTKPEMTSDAQLEFPLVTIGTQSEEERAGEGYNPQSSFDFGNVDWNLFPGLRPQISLAEPAIEEVRAAAIAEKASKWWEQVGSVDDYLRDPGEYLRYVLNYLKESPLEIPQLTVQDKEDILDSIGVVFSRSYMGNKKIYGTKEYSVFESWKQRHDKVTLARFEEAVADLDSLIANDRGEEITKNEWGRKIKEIEELLNFTTGPPVRSEVRVDKKKSLSEGIPDFDLKNFEVFETTILNPKNNEEIKLELKPVNEAYTYFNLYVWVADRPGGKLERRGHIDFRIYDDRLIIGDVFPFGRQAEVFSGRGLSGALFNWLIYAAAQNGRTLIMNSGTPNASLIAIYRKLFGDRVSIGRTTEVDFSEVEKSMYAEKISGGITGTYRGSSENFKLEYHPETDDYTIISSSLASFSKLQRFKINARGEIFERNSAGGLSPKPVGHVRGFIRLFEFSGTPKAKKPFFARSEVRIKPGELLGRQFTMKDRTYEITEFIINRQDHVYVYKAVNVKTDGAVLVKVFNDFRGSAVVPIVSAQILSEREFEMMRLARGPEGDRNPYVPAVGGLIRIENYPALVMEYIPGKILEKWREGVTPEIALAKAVPFLKGLLSIHKKEMMHKDVKPHNVMITDHDKLRIIDFGSAKLLTDLGGGSDTAPLYAAPELFHYGDYTPAAEVYSAGVVLYELAAGRRLFTAKTVPDLKREKDDVEFTAEELTERLEAAGAEVWLPFVPVLQKALAGNPEDRYQNIEDMLADFEAKISGRAEVRTAQQWIARFLPDKNPYANAQEAWETLSQELKPMVADSVNPVPENEFSAIGAAVAGFFERQGWQKPDAREMAWWQTSFTPEHYLASEKRGRLLAWQLLDPVQRLDYDAFQLLSFAMHLRHYGIHFDGDDYLDHELMMNSGRRLMIRVLELRQNADFLAPLAAAPSYKDAQVSLNRDTFMLWILAILFDVSNYDGDLARLKDDRPKARQIWPGGGAQSVPFLFEKLFTDVRRPGPDGELTGELLSEAQKQALYELAAEALAKTDSDWEKLGLIRPSGFYMKGANLTWSSLTAAARANALPFLEPVYNLAPLFPFSRQFQSEAKKMWNDRRDSLLADVYPVKYGTLSRTELSQILFLFDPVMSGKFPGISAALRERLPAAERGRLQTLFSELSKRRSEVRAAQDSERSEVPAVSAERAKEFADALTEIYGILSAPEFRSNLSFAVSIIRGLPNGDFKGSRQNPELQKVAEAWRKKIAENFPDIVPFMQSKTLYGDLLFNENDEAILLFGESESGKGSLGYALTRVSEGRIKISSTDDIQLIRIPGHLLAAPASFGSSIRARAYNGEKFMPYPQYLKAGLIKMEFRLEGIDFKSLAQNPDESRTKAYLPGLFPAFKTAPLEPWPVVMVKGPMTDAQDFEEYALENLARIEEQRRSEVRLISDVSKLEVAGKVTAKILGLDVMTVLFERMFPSEAAEPVNVMNESAKRDAVSGYAKLFRAGASAVLPASLILKLSDKAQNEYFDLIYRGLKENGETSKSVISFAGEGAAELKNKMFRLDFFKLHPEAAKIFETVLQSETVTASRSKNEAVSVSVTAEPEDMSALYRMPSFLVQSSEVGPEQAFIYLHHLTQLQLLAAAQLKRNLSDVSSSREYARLMGEFLNKAGIEYSAQGGLVAPSMNSLLSEALVNYLRQTELVSASA